MCFVESFKASNVLFSGLILLAIMASTSNGQNIEKLNSNSFHTWKMKMEFLVHEKDLCEITLGKLLPQEVEFGEIVPKGGVVEHRLFMEKTNWLVEQFF